MNNERLKLCKKKASALTTQLRLVREEKGISKNELSNRIGMARSAILRIETGQRQPSLLNVIKLCEGLEIELSELIRLSSQS